MTDLTAAQDESDRSMRLARTAMARLQDYSDEFRSLFGTSTVEDLLHRAEFDVQRLADFRELLRGQSFFTSHDEFASEGA